VLVPFRFSVPTPFGLGVLQASYFVANPAPQPSQIPPPAQGITATPVHAKTQ
jgi:hypothetical protein